ncbi:MAG TPA: protease pro-enzyme activation domain-containing protein [Terracidiphilus sp.]|jgi:subtilase family serine protease|nr:protease pro-enzyme activation domain-containing protein [Terracidiphilus sp.]
MKTIFAFSRQNRLRICSILGGCMLSAGTLSAQMPAPRIQSEINSSQMVAVKGSQHPLANPQYDAGRMPSATRIYGITLYFSRSAAQQADLDALLAAQQDPSSPQFHQWLTPDQFAARFGVAQSDMDKVQNWLLQQGFSIDSIARSRNAIRFSGSVGQVESAFQTEMHYYAEDGAKHFAPATALSVPEALAPVVLGVRNLNDFRPKPQHIPARSNFTSGSSGNVFFAPGDIVTAYDIKPLYTAGADGTGQTVAIMGQSYIHVSDVEGFQKSAGLTVKDPTLVLVPNTGSDGVTAKGDESESDLDLEWSGAIGRGATIKFVYTGSNTSFGVYDSAQYAVDNKIGDIISLSYSSCETELSASDLSTLDSIFRQATAQGQTVMAASGDQGSTACSGDTNLSTTQQEAVVVNYPASSAYVTGVGGTEIASGDGAGNSTYWDSSSGSDVINSAKTYIPEIVWNDDPSSCPSGQNCLSASGGGASSLIGKPSYQATLTPQDGRRDVPDISFYSSPNNPGYLYCTSDQSAWDTNDGQVGSCTNGFRDKSSGLLTVAGGTSFAAPIFAGMVAVLNQDLNYKSGQGLINPMLYQLASDAATYSAAFHDVTSGNNDCETPSNCSSTTGFSAGTGYDQATGLGSVDLAVLASAWPASGTVSLVGTTTTIVASSTTPSVNSQVSFLVTVVANSGSAIPSGNVSIAIDGSSATSYPLDSKGTYTLTTSFTTSGTHQVSASYAATGTFAASGQAVATVTVKTVTAGSFKMAASNLTVSQRSSGSSTITVTPSGGYTGTVNLSFDTSNDTALQNLCYSFTTMQSNGNGTVVVSGTTAATTQLTLDTNASDCATAAIPATGMHSFKTLHPVNTLRAGGGHNAPKPGRNPVPAELAFAGLLLAGFLGRHSRKLRKLACVIALVAAGFALSACSSTTTNSVPNPPKGTYTFTVTGTDSATSTITANTTFTFTID